MSFSRICGYVEKSQFYNVCFLILREKERKKESKTRKGLMLINFSFAASTTSLTKWRTIYIEQWENDSTFLLQCSSFSCLVQDKQKCIHCGWVHFYSLIISGVTLISTLCKPHTSLRRTVGPVPKVSILKRVDCIFMLFIRKRNGLQTKRRERVWNMESETWRRKPKKEVLVRMRLACLKETHPRRVPCE